jgi:hypothetical protein
MRRFHEAKTIEAAFGLLADGFAEISERADDLYAVVHRAADSEPQIAALEHDLDDQRWTGVGHLARTAADLFGVTTPTACSTSATHVDAGIPAVRAAGPPPRVDHAGLPRWMLRALTALVPPT